MVLTGHGRSAGNRNTAGRTSLHFVLVVNWGSGLGYREPVMDQTREVFLSAFLVSSALLLWMHLHTVVDGVAVMGYASCAFCRAL